MGVKYVALWAAFCQCAFFAGCSDGEPEGGRFGVCAHISRGEFETAPEECALMRECGIGYVRTDFDISPVKRAAAADFSKWDALVGIAAENGVATLPIFPGGRASSSHMEPYMENLDRLAAFAAECAGHFKGKIKYWEIMNEPNLREFWGGPPSPEGYAKLLEVCSKAIKGADPGAKILFGGLSGVPLDYIERAFKAGAGAHFDVMNVHPYQWAGLPEGGIIRQISSLKRLMEKYSIAGKPIWFTEIGNSSGKINPTVGRIIDAALRSLGMPPEETVFAVISDPAHSYSSCKNRGSLAEIIDNPKGERKILFSEIRDLDVSQTPALILHAEFFPYGYLGDLRAYIARGGTVITAGGQPFFCDIRPGSDGKVAVSVKGSEGAKLFRMGSVGDAPVAKLNPKPRLIKNFETAPGFESVKPEGAFYPCFADTSLLGPGDEFIPILYGVCGGVKAPIAGIYKYGGDMKGGNFVAVYPYLDAVVPEGMQAKLLARSLLVSYAMGAEKAFVYNFRSSEADYTRESHFGLVRRNLAKKPSFLAYQTLAKTLGGAKPNMREKGGVYILDWVRSDGGKVFAVWSVVDMGTGKFSCSGKPAAAFDHLGNRISPRLSEGKIELPLDGGVYYIEGLARIDF